MPTEITGLRRRTAPASVTPNQEGPGLFRRFLAGGIRVGGGILSSPGGWPGAGVGAIAETVAQAAEEVGTKKGFSLDPRRVAIEAGISAIPFGGLVKGGKLAHSMLSSGALTAGGEAARQAYSGNDWDTGNLRESLMPDVTQINPGSVGLAGLLGVASGGIGSKLKSRYDANQPKANEFTVETTAQPGGQVMSGGKQLSATPSSRVIRGGDATSGPTPPRTRVSQEVPYRMGPNQVDSNQMRLDWDAPVTPTPKSPVPVMWDEGQTGRVISQEDQFAGLDFGALSPRRLRELTAEASTQAGRTPKGPIPMMGDPNIGSWVTREAQIEGLENTSRRGLRIPDELPTGAARVPYGDSTDFSTAVSRENQIEGFDFGDIGGATTRNASRWTPDRIEELAQRAEQSGRDDIAAEIRAASGPGRVPYGASEPAPYRPAAKTAQKAEDAIVENQRKLDQAEKMKIGLEPQDPTVTETVAGMTEDGIRVSGSRKYTPVDKAPTAQLKELLTTGKVSRGGQRWKGVSPDSIPNEGTSLEIFQSRLEKGKSPKQALKLAAKGRPPVESGIEVPKAGQPAITTTLADETIEEVPVRTATSAVPGAPTKLSAAMPGNLVDSPDNIDDLVRGADVADEIARKTESDPEVVGELLKFFKPNEVVDLVGENYRALRVAQKENPTLFDELKKLGLPKDSRGRDITPMQLAGRELQVRSKQAGLPETSPAKLAWEFGPNKQAKLAEVAPAPKTPQPETAPTGIPQQAMSGDPNQQLEDTARLMRGASEAGVPKADIPETVDWLDKLRQLGRDKRGGGTSAGFMGLTPDVIRAAQNNPELAAQLLTGGIGAGVGAAVSDDPLVGAGVGFGAGFAAPKAVPAILKAIGAPVEAMQRLSLDLTSPEGVKKTVEQITKSLPQLQRFNLLADAYGLPANAIVGPWGSAVMGALEHALSGDPRGMHALAELRNPAKFVAQFSENADEAWQKLRAGEVGRSEQGLIESLPEKFQQRSVAFPGWAMTTGDITARRILINAGFSVEEAKRITLTNTPKEGLFHWMAESGKEVPALGLMFPFRRTPTNIAQQGLIRTPLGYLMKHDLSPEQHLVSQGLSAGVGVASYVAGNNMSPENAKNYRRFITNVSGQYSLVSGLGFMLGQANQQGVSLNRFQKAQLVDSALPLPTTGSIQDFLGFIGGGELPRGASPRVLEQWGVTGKPDIVEQVRTNIPGLRRR